MSAPPLNAIVGSIKIVGLPERESFTGFRDFWERLPELVEVELPAGATGIVFSSTEPGEDYRNSLWVNRDNNGIVLGLYSFQGGKWKQIQNTILGEIRWIYGDSDTTPDGWKLIITGDDTVPDTVVAHLVPQYLTLSAGRYSFYAVRFVGS